MNHFAEHPSMHVEVAPMVICKDINHLEVYYQDILDAGGEGIILRDPKTPYEAGRSKGYLKHKVRLPVMV